MEEYKPKDTELKQQMARFRIIKIFRSSCRVCSDNNMERLRLFLRGFSSDGLDAVGIQAFSAQFYAVCQYWVESCKTDNLLKVGPK